ARGWTLREIGPQVDCAFATVGRIAQRGSRRPGRGDGWVPGPGRLTLADREEITVGLHAGESFTVIAARLRTAASTGSRGGGGRARQGGLDGVAGGGGQRRPGRLPGVAGASAGPRPGAAAQDTQAGLPAAGRPGHRVAGRMVVAAANIPPVADRVPRRSHDVG